MQVRRAACNLRTELFPTLPRESTESLSIAYTNTAADPRIDAAAIDAFDAQKSVFGILFHYVIKIDGTIEIGRDPRTRSTRTRNHAATMSAIHVGVVGGLDPETGDRAQTTTPEQEGAVEWLMQKLADTLNVPLEVHDARERWTVEARRDHAESEAEAALEATLDAAETKTNATSGY